jgi:hypothetical protein
MSATTDLTDRQRTMLRALLAGARERAAAEEAAAEAYYDRVDAAEAVVAEDSKALAARHAVEADGAAFERDESRAAALARRDEEIAATREDFHRDHDLLREEYEAGRAAARNALQEASWTAAALVEATKAQAEASLREQEKRVAEKKARLGALRDEARKLLRQWKQPEEYLDWTGFDESGPPAFTRGKLPRCLRDAERLLGDLYELTLPQYLQWRRVATNLLFAWAALVVPAGWLTQWLLRWPTDWVSVATAGVPVGLVVAGICVLGMYYVLGRVAGAQVRRVTQPLGVCFHAADARVRHLTASLNARCARRIRVAQLRHDRTLRRARRRYRQERLEVSRRRRTAFPTAKAVYMARRAAATRRRAEELLAAERRYDERVAAEAERIDAERSRLNRRLERARADARADYERALSAFAGSWRRVLDSVATEHEAIAEALSDLFPAWDAGRWTGWQPPAALPPVLCFGTVFVGHEQVPHAVPADERLEDLLPPDLALPALTPCPAGASVVLRARGEGRARAVSAIQGVMFRLLTTVPPGKVRFTILDPLGLGENFAGFMHLADHEPALVGGRIWTEPAQVDQRVAELTARVETVIQKYLRDRFASLADYNASAAEVAEPYHVLVVANFPACFSGESARRLARLSASGPRCGVHVLVSTDEDLPTPHGFDYRDLHSAVRLTWDGRQFRWADDDFGTLPLELEAPPPAALADRLLDRIGRAAKLARRVEVPFDYIAPPHGEWWQADGSAGLTVALGRAAAGGRQYLKLGEGTSQHVVIAGKTGSGKSTLVHALVTNLALNYSPDEVELYLVDFKKGVEFKTYAARSLPHARVVAIESEREFGLSVLQRLDAELRRRGELFRTAGVQDLPAYRTAGRRLPRVLLVVDEFQEFFVEDDRLAQDAAGLLDRLVRQGRAFGLHVLLGSQTIGGAFSLARSTIDQMAVRIALQCSEADAQLVLSMENTAAKYLTRPGEAIYNDANGREEGNHLFQVVWLDEARRENYLVRLRERAAGRAGAPAVVFEGNAPADVRRNALLAALLHGSPAPDDGAGRRAWLGESMALGDPATVLFRRAGGANLVIVGQQEDTALGMLATVLVGLALPQPPASLVVVDGASANPPTNGIFARLAGTLPCPVKLAGTRQAVEVLAELSTEVANRQSAGTAGPPVFLVIAGLHRCRDLRRAEDDFGFSRRDGDARVPPALLLADLLRDGPPVGVHVLAWCDTLNNLQRALDRQAMRELGFRVAMQMGVADASTFIDSPAPAKLGMHRAILFSEEDGRLEKFRPYGPPPDGWLGEVNVRTDPPRPVKSPEPARGVVRIALSGSENPLQ